MIRAFVLVLAGLIGGCEAPPTTADCEAASPADLTGTASSGERLAPVDSALTIEGTAAQAGGLAIRTVQVGGVTGSATAFNYGQWSAEVPWEVLSDLAGEGSEATLPVVLRDACDQERTVAELVVAVSPIPGGEVTRLDVEVDLPGNLGWLPADGRTPALVRLVANPQARGTAVDLAVSLGDLDGAAGARLSGDGTSDADLQLLFTSDQAGSALLTATADDRLITQTIRVAGPPSVDPAIVDVQPGERVSLTARSEGAVRACTADTDPGIAVTSGGIDLTRGEAAVDSNGDGHPDVLVEAAFDAASGATAVVRCVDPFGQAGTSSVRVP